MNKHELDQTGMVTDIRLALVLHPLDDPNVVVSKAVAKMLSHNIYSESRARFHLLTLHRTDRPYDFLKHAFKIHEDITGV
jgi:hypothetical protein